MLKKFVYIVCLLSLLNSYAGQMQMQDELKEIKKQKLDNLNVSQYEEYKLRRDYLLAEDYKIYVQKGDSMLGDIINTANNPNSNSYDKELAKRIAKEIINFVILKETLHYIDVPDNKYKKLSKEIKEHLCTYNLLTK